MDSRRVVCLVNAGLLAAMGTFACSAADQNLGSVDAGNAPEAGGGSGDSGLPPQQCGATATCPTGEICCDVHFPAMDQGYCAGGCVPGTVCPSQSCEHTPAGPIDAGTIPCGSEQCAAAQQLCCDVANPTGLCTATCVDITASAQQCPPVSCHY
jgi:hypothetical protein